MKKVLITGDIHSILQEKFEKLGFACETRLDITYEEVKAVINNYEGLIIRSLKVDKELIDAASNLKFIGRAGSGLENVDITYAISKNIHVVNSPEGNRSAVAEHAIGMLLSLLHQFKKGNNEVGRLVWDRNGNSGEELSAQTVGVIGFGNVGQSFAEKIKNFGCRILVYDKYKKGFNDLAGIEEVNLEYLLENSTVISLHLPLTKETENFVDESFLKKLKKKPILLNTARGELINIQLLKKALDENQIAGLGLDVFPKEPISKMSSKDKGAVKLLSERPNVLLTPHSAGLSRQSYVKLATVLAEKITVIL